MAFPGTITLKPSTMIASMVDWSESLARHGFERIYWLNGHGGNIATITAAFSEIYHGVTFAGVGCGTNRPPAGKKARYRRTRDAPQSGERPAHGR